MKILVLSFYFQPDLCAGSFRSTALINEFKSSDECEVEVISTLPNRYASFSINSLELEQDGNITIHRVKLPTHKSGMLDQIKAFYSYYREVKKITRYVDYDIVYATSSRLFTAFLGARIAGEKRIPLYLDIRDIFVDTISDVLPSKVALLVKPIFSYIETYTFQRAQRINLVSKGFQEYFEQRHPDTVYRWYTNGIDKEFMNIKLINQSKSSNQCKLKVLYAGNIGEGQGLHNILPDLAKLFIGRIEFIVIGDGGRKAELEKQLELNDITNVCILPPIKRTELIKHYQNADVLFLHLNDYPAFKKVLPSKIFEYAALGKPIWAGVSGYAAEFLNLEVENSAVFESGNFQQAKKVFESLNIKNIRRDAFLTKYSRANIMSQMANDIIEFASKEAFS